MARLVGVLSGPAQIIGALSGESALSGEVSRPTVISPGAYDGPYEFIPGDTARTVEIKGLMAKQDIIIDPIPNNYGRITWNGSVITVS